MKRENLILREETTMLDIISDDTACGGVVAAGPDGVPYTVGAGAVVLACGGIGGLFKNSTNFPHITGDALAIAMRRNIAVQHLDYIQIHPTTLYSTRPGRRFLISESTRARERCSTTKTDSGLRMSCSRGSSERGDPGADGKGRNGFCVGRSAAPGGADAADPFSEYLSALSGGRVRCAERPDPCGAGPALFYGRYPGGSEQPYRHAGALRLRRDQL